jgi:two-component sensor histidine kinase
MRATTATGRSARSVEPSYTDHASRWRTLYFLAAAVLAALIPVILFAGLWVRSELRESQRDLESFLTSRALALSQTIDAEVQRGITALQAMAALPSLDQPNLSEFHTAAARMVAAIPQWSFVSLVDRDGRQVLNTLRPVGEDLPPIGGDAIRRAAEANTPCVSTRLAGENGTLYDGRVVLICVPVIRNGEARGVLIAGMKAQSVQQLLLRQRDDERLLSVVIDERDRIVARSRAPDRYVGGQANDDLRGPTAGQSFGLFTASTLDGQDVLTSFQRSPLTGWLSVMAADRGHFDEITSRSRWAMVATGILSLTIASVLGIFVFYNVMERRVSEERLAASRALGELDARLLATTQEALAEQRKAASEREVLLREIYHRVKNNLQIVQSLLRLGSRNLNDEQREPFESAVRRIGAMARVHTLLYNSPDLASIDFREYLEGLVREIGEAFAAEERGIATELKAESMRVPLDTAVPLAFVAAELMTNAYKHAFPGGRRGTISVAIGRDNGHGVLTIGDNGVGFSADAVSGRPLGLTIVTKLVQQIGGTFEEPKAGEAVFRIIFPLDGQAPKSTSAGDKPATVAQA